MIPIKKPTACPGFNGHAGVPQPQRDQRLESRIDDFELDSD